MMRLVPLRMPRALALVACAALLVLGLARPLLAHLELVESTPAAGEELARAPDALRLRFTQPVQLAFSEVRLSGPGGAVEVGALALAADSGQVLVAPISGTLAPGDYTVRWRVAGADGHPISGEYTFRVGGGGGATAAAAGGAADRPVPAGAGQAPDTGGAHGEVGSGGGRAAAAVEFGMVRWATFAALLALIGAAAFRWVVLSGWLRRGDHAGHGLRAPMERRTAALGAAAAAVLLLAGAARIYLQADAVGVEIGDLSRLRQILVGTPWGWGWLLQMVGATLALGGLATARRGAGAGWAAAAIGALLAALSPALSGHAAAAQHAGGLAIVADALHVVGAGGWIGTLLVLSVVGLPLARTLGEGEFAPAARTLVQAFSPVALAFAALVVITGVFAAWVHLGSASALWETRYGRILLVKLGLLVPVLAAGAYNWRRATPGLTTGRGAATLRRSAALELTAALLVLAATAFLVATPPPAEPTPPPPAAAG